MRQKLLNLLLLAGIFYTNAFAQPVITSQKDFGGNYYDDLTSMALTKDGGYIVGGYSYSNKSGDKSEDSRGLDDYWVVKLDASRRIQWDKTIGGNGSDQLPKVQQTNDGGYILGGTSSSNKSGEKTQNSKGESDIWIVKLDSEGNIQWDKTIGGSNFDDFKSLQKTADGGYILGGTSSSNKSGDKTENSRGVSDYWVVKLNGQGQIQWDKTIGGNNWDGLRSLQQTADGGYILGGWSISNKSGEKTENGRGLDDYWVVKLNSQGQIQWDKTIGGSGDDDVYSFKQAPDGGYLVGGYSKSNKSGDKTENSKGDNDYWIVKLSSTGQIQWDKTIGGSSDDMLMSVQNTRDGGYLVGGYSESIKSGEKTENGRGASDYWVVKLDSRGKIQWDKTIGGSNYEYLYDMREVSKNRYVLGGSSESGISGDKTQPSKGESDYWVVWLSYNPVAQTFAATSQNTDGLIAPNNKTFIVYPNPAKDILSIQTNGKATFSLTNQSGKLLLSKTIFGRGEINVARLPGGVYFLKNNESGVVKKVMVEK